MIALLLATIGLLGTVAVQQTMFNATANANDAAIATRLATQAMEEFQSRTVRVDLDQLATQVTADWTNATYLNAAGVANATQTPDFRFKRETLVINQGVHQPVPGLGARDLQPRPGRGEDHPHRPAAAQDMVTAGDRAPARRRDPRAGLTLVELMITIIISSIVATSTFFFFVGQRRVYDTQAKVLNVQQNLWAAMETLTRFVRGAGMGIYGCVNATDPTPTGATMPQTGLRVFQKSTGASMRLAPIWINNGAAGAPDAITVVFGAGSFGNFTDANLKSTVTAATSAITAPAGLSAIFRTGEFIVLLDNTAAPAGPPTGDRGCTLFQITGIDSTTDTSAARVVVALERGQRHRGRRSHHLHRRRDADRGHPRHRHAQLGAVLDRRHRRVAR